MNFWWNEDGPAITDITTHTAFILSQLSRDLSQMNQYNLYNPQLLEMNFSSADTKKRKRNPRTIIVNDR